MPKQSFASWTFRARTFASATWAGETVSGNDIVHSIEEILQSVLIGLGVGSDPDDGLEWPIFAPVEPDQPDNCLTIQEYTGIETGSNALTGQMYVHYGFQVRVRAQDATIGGRKAHSLFRVINEQIDHYAVSLDDQIYCADSATTAGTVNHLGLFHPEMRLELYTVNATVDIRRLV